MTTTFFRFALRTTDAEGARSFYAAVLGHPRASIWPLHENAIARGASPHWLGSLAVEDLERALAAFVDRGATPLGPSFSPAEGGRAANLRDPGGAVVSLATRPGAETESAANAADVRWHVLNTNDAPRARKTYAELCGWEFTKVVDLGARGTFQQFAWLPGGANVGAVADIATRPGVHPHWLFFFEVGALDSALARVREGGGVVVEIAAMPDGRRYGVCDDPQGAAFGLCERLPAEGRG